MNTRQWTLGILVAASALLLPGRAGAQGSEGQITYGGQWWTQTAPEAKYREYTDLNRGGYMSSFLWKQWGEKASVTAYGSDILKRDQAVGLQLSSQARWTLDLKLENTPHVFSYTARTPYTMISPGVYVLPDLLQATNQKTPGGYNNAMLNFLSNAPGTDLSVQTNVTSARLRSRPSGALHLDFRTSVRDRSGAKPYGAAFGFNSAVEIPEPIDQTTVDADATASYDRDRVSVRASLGVSAFKNHVSTLIWDNPKRLSDTTYASAYVAGDGTSKGRLDLYPDNHAIRGSIALGLHLPHSTFLAATVGISELRQNDPWLPATINTAIQKTVAVATDTFVVGKSTNGRAERVNLDSRLTTRLTSGLQGALKLHLQNYNDKTEEHTFFGLARLDQVWEAETLTSEPRGNRTTSLAADLEYRLTPGVSLRGTAEHVQRKHDVREILEDKENLLGLRARVELVDAVSLDARARFGKRKADAFESEDYLNEARQQVEQAGLRRFDLAPRDRYEYGGMATWMPAESFDLSTEVSSMRYDYPESRYGLQRSLENMWLGQATLRPMDSWELTGGYGLGRLTTRQASNESNHTAPVSNDPQTDWWAQVRDRNQFAFARADWQASPKKLNLYADYEYSRDQASYHFTTSVEATPRPTVIPLDLPDTYYRHHQLSLGGRMRVAELYELGAEYAYDEYRVVDFATQGISLLGVAPGGQSNLYLGDNSLGYSAHRLRVSARRRF